LKTSHDIEGLGKPGAGKWKNKDADSTNDLIQAKKSTYRYQEE